MTDLFSVSFMERDSLKTHEDLARLVADISISLMNVDDEGISTHLVEVLKIVSGSVRQEWCGIFQFSGDGTGVYGSHASDGTAPKGSLGLDVDGSRELVTKMADLAAGDIPQVGHLSGDVSPEGRLLAALGFVEGIVVPLSAGRGTFGFLFCGSRRVSREPLTRIERSFLGIVAKMIANVLEHRRASDSLASSERKMETLIERLSDDYFFYRHDTNGIFTHVSDSVRNVLGYEPGEFLGHYAKYLTDSPINSEAVKATQLSIRGIRQDPYEVEVLCKDGKIVTLEVSEISVEYAAGKVVAVEGMAHNITARKKYEELIRRRKDELERMVEERTVRLNRMNEALVAKVRQYEEAKRRIDRLVGELEVILDSVPAQIFYKDLDHRFIRVNRAFAEFFGGTKEAFRGKTYFDLGFGRYGAEEFTREDALIMETGEPIRQAVAKVVVKNTPRWLVIDKIPYRDGNGAIIGIIGFALDISDFKNAEELIFSLNKRLTEAEEIERLRISRYLHDTVAQNLSRALIDCNIFLDEYAGASSEILSRFEALSRILRESVAQIRRLSYDLRPPHFEKMGISNAVYSFCEEFKTREGIEVDFLSAGMEEMDADFNLQINLYRIVQEALNNVRKHAGAGRVKIRLVASYPDIILRVEDDGVGFEVPASFDAFLAKKCMGLQGMRERVQLLGGDFHVHSRKGAGTKLYVRIPMNPGGERAGG